MIPNLSCWLRSTAVHSLEDRKSVWRYDADASGGHLNYKLTDKGSFQNFMIDLGSNSRPAIADINGDGLLDLLIGGYHFTDGAATRIPSCGILKILVHYSNPILNWLLMIIST